MLLVVLCWLMYISNRKNHTRRGGSVQAVRGGSTPYQREGPSSVQNRQFSPAIHWQQEYFLLQGLCGHNAASASTPFPTKVKTGEHKRMWGRKEIVKPAISELFLVRQDFYLRVFCYCLFGWTTSQKGLSKLLSWGFVALQVRRKQKCFLSMFAKFKTEKKFMFFLLYVKIQTEVALIWENKLTNISAGTVKICMWCCC